MNRQPAVAVPVDNDTRRPDVPQEASEGYGAATRKHTEREKEALKRALVVTLLILVVLVAGFALRLSTDPELRKALSTSAEERTAQLVVDRMRTEFVMKERSQDNEGHEHHGPMSSSKGTHKDSVIRGCTDELHQRLDHLESLMTQLAEKFVAFEGAAGRGATPEGGNQLEKVNLRLDRIESLLSRPSTEDDHPNRGTASQSHGSTTQTKNSAGDPLFCVFIFIGFAVLVCLGAYYREANKAEKRRRLAEAVAERLALDRKFASS